MGEACPNCNYDLAGLPEPRCPECGEIPEKFLDRRAWKRRGWLLAAVIGAAAVWALLMVRIVQLAFRDETAETWAAAMFVSLVGVLLVLAAFAVRQKWRDAREMRRADFLGLLAIVAMTGGLGVALLRFWL